jgi:hypothetical protein
MFASICEGRLLVAPHIDLCQKLGAAALKHYIIESHHPILVTVISQSIANPSQETNHVCTSKLFPLCSPKCDCPRYSL